MRALVLSGGGMFGAWQVGAWAAIEEQFRPDLIVGASIGSLNGYAIASGATPVQLGDLWRSEQYGQFANLPESIRGLMQRPLRMDFAVVITDLLRLKPRIVRGPGVTWQHLAASCAIPVLLPQVRIDGRFYTDGGLLNPLPIYAAVELGATEIIGLNALPDIPVSVLRPFIRAFRAMFGHHPPLPKGVSLRTILPSRELGSVTDAIKWKRDNVDRWIEQGRRDAAT
jgi:predicted acylesterase/phospholipase RssA